MAAAGSAVGLGNIWRFPYLAAKDGGGVFILVYIVLALTFGFTLLTTEIALGRKVKRSPLTAYGAVSKRWKWLGLFSCLVPGMIMTFYVVIGGWVLKYFIAFLFGQSKACAEPEYFGNFIAGIPEPTIYMVIFGVLCGLVVMLGVSEGIEKVSKILMPTLLLMILGIAIFSLTVKKTGDDGTVVTGMQGLKELFIPKFEGMTVSEFFRIMMDALGQLFFSLSVAAGVMVAYGSYVPDETDLVKSVGHIEFFDTVVAILAGVMILPAVYVFEGTEGMSQGPSLMFVSLPKVFMEMGPAGDLVGAAFFGMVLFAAVTSGISLLEAFVSSMIDRFDMSRKRSTLISTVVIVIVGFVLVLGYNVWKFDIKLPTGSTGQFLDVMDYLVNQLAMPFVAIATCILIGWVKKPDYIISEVTKNGEKFGRAKLYIVMIKYVAPAMLILLFFLTSGIIRLG